MPDISQLSDQDLEKALGYNSGKDITKISDADLHNMLTPADESSDMKNAQWGSQNPYLRAMQKTGNEAIVNPIVQAVNGVSPAINGMNKLEGNNYRIPQIQEPDMSNAPMAAKIEGDIAGGAGQGLAATAMGGGNPILGYGALSGASAFGKGEPVIPAVIKGAAMAVPQIIAGKFGSSLANAAAKPIGGIASKYASNVGTALGMGGASAAQANAAGQNPIEAGASGAAFGLMSPMNPLGSKIPMTSVNHDAMVEKEGAPIYRNILNPGKGIINKIEMKSGGDIDSLMKLAAKEALPISSNEGKLDNSAAIEKLKSGNANLYDQQNQILASNSEKQFNIQQLGDQVKAGLSKNTKSASDLDAAKAKVDNEINAEILRHGENVDGQTLNMIKQGMWGKSYNPLEPNANDSARAIGFAAKDEIEKAYPLDSIKENNQALGQRLQLQKILEATHGQVIQGGKVGKYVSGAIGGAVGEAAGQHFPLMGEALGPIVGFKAGEKVNQYLNDPARITGNWAKKLANINIVDEAQSNTRRSGIIDPEILNGPISRNIPMQNNLEISMNPSSLKLGYDQVGAMGRDRISQEQPGIITPPPGKSSGMPINQPSNPGSLSLGYNGENIRNPYFIPKGSATSSNPIPMRGASMSSTNPININPKTSAYNGPLKPNLRAQIDMSKGGTPKGISEPIITPPKGTAENEQTFPQGSMNPLRHAQQAIGNAKNKLTSDKSGEIDTSGLSADDLNKQLQMNQKYIGTREYKSDASYKKMIDDHIQELKDAIKKVGGSALGLNMGASAIAATALGAGSVFNPSNSQAQSVKDPDRLKMPANQYTMKNEGWQGMPYLDSNGNKTVGYGFKDGGMAWKYVPDAVKQGRRSMTKEEGMAAFNKSYPSAIESARSFAGDSWSKLSVNQQKSLTDMSYQMGSLNDFPNLKKAIEGGHYNTAAREILNSKYARTDAPQRALQNAILMQS